MASSDIQRELMKVLVHLGSIAENARGIDITSQLKAEMPALLSSTSKAISDMYGLLEWLRVLQTEYGRKQHTVPFAVEDVPQAFMEEEEDREEEEEADEEGEGRISRQKKKGGRGGVNIKEDGICDETKSANCSLYTLIQRHKSLKRKLRKWRKLTRTLIGVVNPNTEGDSTGDELLSSSLNDVVKKFAGVHEEIENLKRNNMAIEDQIIAIKTANARNEVLISNFLIGSVTKNGESIDSHKILRSFIASANLVVQINKEAEVALMNATITSTRPSGITREVEETSSCALNYSNNQQKSHYQAITITQELKPHIDNSITPSNNSNGNANNYGSSLHNKNRNNSSLSSSLENRSRIFTEALPLVLIAGLVFFRLRK